MSQAPEFPDLPWLNTPHPLRLRTHLAEKVVLLHFFAYTNIHSLHTLDELRSLQEKYAHFPLQIIGIHVSKYDATNNLAALAAALERHNITHPVILDEQRQIWNHFHLTSWPTIMLLAPGAQIIGLISGEGHLKLLEHHLNRAFASLAAKIPEAGAFGDDGQTSAAGVQPSAMELRFPTKIVPDMSRNRLFILDTNHHRILITTLPNSNHEISLLHTIGSSLQGAVDGPFPSASFNRPQGAAISPNGQILYVADTDNHLVRRIHLAHQTVQTVLGTGSATFDHEAGKTSREQPLNSPHDLALHGNRLYIAQSGQHQIFAMNLMSLMTEVAAGTAREGVRDGEAQHAYLAQPSGLAFDAASQTLYFTDAQSSAVRALHLPTHKVTTLLGDSLFSYGDCDGPAAGAQLQHPLALTLAADGQSLLIADTLNHKIKVFSPVTQRVETVTLGGGVELHEPAGVAPHPTVKSPRQFIIADTNHHRLLLHDPDGQRTSPLVLILPTKDDI